MFCFLFSFFFSYFNLRIFLNVLFIQIFSYLFILRTAIPLTVCSVVGKFFVSIAFAVLYVWAAEVFPTVVRNVGVGGSSMAARIGSLVAPQIGRLVSILRNNLDYLLDKTTI